VTAVGRAYDDVSRTLQRGGQLLTVASAQAFAAQIVERAPPPVRFPRHEAKFASSTDG